jgi:hypothetical protein
MNQSIDMFSLQQLDYALLRYVGGDILIRRKSSLECCGDVKDRHSQTTSSSVSVILSRE